jgi:hypothetical protein
MKNNRQTYIEILILTLAIGLIATFSAPWYEMRGSYAAWRIDEWHAFWRGTRAFMLDSVVSSNMVVPIEYATTAMQSMLENMFLVGGILGAWHSVVLAVLLVLGARIRTRAGVSRVRAVFESVALVFATLVILGILAWFFTLPSSLTTKVDFRTELDVHTDSLIWSNADIVFLVPGLSIAAALAQIFIAIRMLKTG